LNGNAFTDFSFSSNFEKRDMEIARLFRAARPVLLLARPLAAVGASLFPKLLVIPAVVGLYSPLSFALLGIIFIFA